MVYKEGDKIILTETNSAYLYAYSLSLNKEYTIIGIHKHDDGRKIYAIENDDGAIVSSKNFILSPKYKRNNVIDEILS